MSMQTAPLMGYRSGHRWVFGLLIWVSILTGCGADPPSPERVTEELRSDPATALLQHRDIPYPSTQGRSSLVGDFDGNGIGDVVEWMYDWAGTTGLSLTMARGRAGSTPSVVTRHLGDQLPRTLAPLVADISGDGRDDLVFAGLGVTGGTGLGVRVLISNGDGTWTRREQRLGDGLTPTARLLTGDVDGDGRDDLVLLFTSTSYVVARTKLSNGDGTWRAASEQGIGVSVAAYPSTTVHLGDVDGDGRADLVAAGWDLDGSGTGLAVRVRTSNGNGLWATRDARFDTPREALDRRPLLRDLDDDGRASLATERVELAGLGAELLRSFGARASEAQLRLDIALGGAIEADPLRLRELLEALLDNAIRYTRKGGEVGVRSRPAHDGVQIEVWDTGRGIEPSEREQVFERFFRGSAAQQSGQPGTGLGLAIVRAIVDAHGASIRVEPNDGGGTRFVTTWPQTRSSERSSI